LDGLTVYLSFTRDTSHTDPMDELERLRQLVGPEASGWTTAQLEQLGRDIDAMAVLLLDLSRSCPASRSAKTCGSPNFDVQQPDR
jgi:hypothetical protein